MIRLRAKFLILIMLVIGLLFSFNVTANTPDLSVTLISQSPDPVEPGQTVNLKFKVENDGDSTDNDMVAKLIYDYPFSIYGDESEKDIGIIPASGTGIEVEFNLKIDDDAVEEEATVNLELYANDDVSYIFEDFTIDIETHDAVLDISSIETSAEILNPGDTLNVEFTIRNLADSLLKDIKFKLELGDDDLPFAPYLSSSERRVAQLNTNYQSTFDFDIISSPEARVGLYKIPINITYSDENGNAYSYEDWIAVQVGISPTLNAYIKKTDVIRAGQYGDVTLQIANTGISDVKSLELELIESTDYQLLSTSDYFYIGDLDADDTESEEINIYVAEGMSEVNIPIKLTYSDANNQEYQQNFYLDITLYSEEELKKFGFVSNGGFNAWYLLILVVIAGIVFYFIRRRKKKKAHHD